MRTEWGGIRVSGTSDRKPMTIARWVALWVVSAAAVVASWTFLWSIIDTPTKDISLLNDTGSAVTLQTCVDGRSDLDVGESLTITAPLRIGFDRCVVYSARTLSYQGCLILHLPNIAEGATVSMSDLDAGVRFSACDRE